MNITFLLRSLAIGGVNVVSSVLANKFVSDGHHVSCFSFCNGTDEAKERFDKGIPFVIGNGFEYNNENVSILRKMLIDNKTDIVINQWGSPLIPIKTLNKAKEKLQIKIISIYHNDPLQHGRIHSVQNEIISLSGNYFKKFKLLLKKYFFRCAIAYAVRYNYRHSDSYVVLSAGYMYNFKAFTKIVHPKKLSELPNPITIDNNDYIYRSSRKGTEVLYVGRLDETQKCVQRIIKAWAQIETKSSIWKLTIVGDGKDNENVIELSKKLRIQYVNFVGIQNPRPYYERASILLLTSDFEGFPLVLAEAMQFGVVPIVYGSFKAVYDIIDDGVNGFITPTPYSINDTVDRLLRLMNNENLREQMAIAAIEKAKLFSIDKIAKRWYTLMNALNNK